MFKEELRSRPMDEKELLPCPFCGIDNPKIYDNAVMCRSCGSSGPDLGHCTGDIARADSIAAWNRRDLSALNQAVEAETEACAKEAENYRSNGNPFPTIYVAIANSIRGRKDKE